MKFLTFLKSPYPHEEKDKSNIEIIRNTFKKTEDIIEKKSNFVRCHKSYIANLSKLKKITGNAQGYILTFNHLNFEITVSRKLSKQIINQDSVRCFYTDLDFKQFIYNNQKLFKES